MKKSTQHFVTMLFARYQSLKENEEQLINAFEQMKQSYLYGGKLLVCGNGGSAADSDHIVGELMKGFLAKRTIDGDLAARINKFDSTGQIAPRLQMPLPAINLSAHTALITAICNDNSSDMIFAQQVLGYGKEGDVLLGISTSGNSIDVLNAGIVAKSQGLKTIGLTGTNGGKMNQIFDLMIKVPESSTAGIQELHLPIWHTLCAMLEEEFFGKDSSVL